MKLQLRYFAALREQLGPTETLELSAGTTVGGLRDALLEISPRHAEVLARGRAVRIALNQRLCDETAVLADGDEVAFFPPVTGG
jgi:sulfur-carrier protein